MAEAWFKVAAGLPVDSKITYIRSQPNGDSMCLLWIFLLCRATTLNAGGRVFIAPGVPYTAKQLAIEFGMKPATVEAALGLFERLGMISTGTDGIEISKWAVHQNVDGMERARAKAAQRQAAFRARQHAETITAEIECDDAYRTSNKARAKVAQMIVDKIQHDKLIKILPPDFHELTMHALAVYTPDAYIEEARKSGGDIAKFIAALSKKGVDIE